MPKNAAVSSRVSSLLLAAACFTVLWSAAPRAAQAEAPQFGSQKFFVDDFNRAPGPIIGNGWLIGRAPEGCETLAEAGVAPPPPQVAVYQMTPVSLQDGRILVQESRSQAPWQIWRVFNRPIDRLELDMIPERVMGGTDDRARIGVRVQFVDDRDQVIGEIWRYVYNTHYLPPRNTPNRYVQGVKAFFDAQPRHVVIDVADIARVHLKDLEMDRVAQTRVMLELTAGWCGSDIAGSFDNVVAYAEREPIFEFSPQEVLAITRSAQTFFTNQSAGFPNNWIMDLKVTHGDRRLSRWVEALRSYRAQHPRDFPSLTAQLSDQTGLPAMATGFALLTLLDNYAPIR
ncbi:hypothetical protein [Magnetofaba australis]|uniref:Uncharacterized protein n=1 Tax=Magnetofaba australis IT-1 TaxID=1434232 RepID=A0A1Y2K115_9PROT|nr:hypothetical protein [Magnetofaba australis]OSM01639.1 hypothetical protein MAIT1_01651 [Magnetofaba australis IT-1]